MSRNWRALTTLACAAVLAGACNRKGEGPSAGREVVARVGATPITRGYFEQRIVKMERRFLPDTLDLAGKRKFLEFIINKEVMAQKAEEMKYGEDPRVTSAMQSYGDGLAAKVAIDRLTEGKLEPTDAEIQEFYRKKHTKVLTKHILLRTRHEAEDVRKKLMAGADFDSLVSQYSVVPRKDANTGEDLPLTQRAVFGDVQYGEAMPQVEDAIFGTKIGEVSQPVETGYGWHLFKPVSTSEVTIPQLDTEATHRMSVQIQLRRKGAIAEAYYAEIAKQHGYQVDEDALLVVYDKLPVDVNPENRPDPKTEVKPILPFTQQERDRQLFQLDGKKYTIGDLSDRYDGTSWFERPKRVSGVLGVKYWIRDRWMKPLQLERARKDGIYELPEVADELRIRREQMMVMMLHENLIAGQAPEPTDDQIQEFYKKHDKVYVDKEKRSVNLIYSQHERVVQRAWDEIQGGASFVEVAVRYNENATKPEDVQTEAFSADNEQFKELASKAFALQKVGDMTEPFKTQQFWVMMQLAHILPERKLALDEIKESVKEDWKNQWSEDKLNELLTQWKKDVKIEVNDAALERARVDRTDVYVPGQAAGGAGAGAAGAAK